MKLFRLTIFTLLATGVALANSPVDSAQPNNSLSASDKQLLIDLNKQINELQGQVQQAKSSQESSKSSSSDNQFSTYSSQVGETLNTSNHYLDLESNGIRSAAANEITANISQDNAL